MDYLKSHIRVVASLVIREMSTRFGTKPGGYIWALLDPVAYISFLSVIFMAIARKPALGTSFALFFATGYIALQFYQAMVNYINSAVSGNRALLNYPNVAPIDTVVARYILQFFTTCVVGFVIFAAIALTLRAPIAIHWPSIIEASLAGTLLALGIGLSNNVLFTQFPLYEQLFGIVSRPLFMISGVFYLPDSMPQPAKELLLFNPLTHAIMLFRKGFYPEYRASGLDMGYMYNVSLTLLFIGLAIFTFSRRQLRGR